MFSSVFDKVVSATAPDILTTFPPRAALPVPSSTICCLSFADRFLSLYPAGEQAPGDPHDVDAGLAGRMSPTGIAVSADDLNSTIQNAAELGGRLAAALAGKVRPKARDPETASVFDLLAKVRGIFGNRLVSVGRDIRIARGRQAERDESLLLNQLHVLKNAALEGCRWEKWCIIVSSGGDSLAVCSVPLAAVEGASVGCDFLVFDPWPRPAMNLCGSYVVKFTTIRGLQLHLLSALGDIWKRRSLHKEGSTGADTVGLSVVVAARRNAEVVVDVGTRHVLEHSVTRLRRAEKAALIKSKREEVEALRKALASAGQKNSTAIPESVGGKHLEIMRDMKNEEGTVHHQTQSSEVGVSLIDGDGRDRQASQTATEHLPELSVEETEQRDDTPPPFVSEDVVALQPSPRPSQEPVGATLQCAMPEGEVHLDDRVEAPISHSSPRRSRELRPPTTDVSPVRLAHRREHNGSSSFFMDDQSSPDGITTRSNPNPEMGRPVDGVGENVGTHVDEGAPTSGVIKPGYQQHEREKGLKCNEGTTPFAERTELVGTSYAAAREETPTVNDPLNQVLLRSVEGEGLAEYSMRAYNTYRTHGVILEGVVGDERRPATRAVLSLSIESHGFNPAMSVSVGDQAVASPPDLVVSNRLVAEAQAIDQHGEREATRQGLNSADLEDREPVLPFSPPSRGSNGFNDELSANGTQVNPKPQSKIARAPEEEPRVGGKDKHSENTDKTNAPQPVLRSRLQAPRAGLVAALAARKARGSDEKRPKRSPNFRQDSPGNPLPPAPPPAGTYIRRQLHTRSGGAESAIPGYQQQRGQHAPAQAFSAESASDATGGAGAGATVGEFDVEQRVVTQYGPNHGYSPTVDANREGRDDKEIGGADERIESRCAKALELPEGVTRKERTGSNHCSVVSHSDDAQDASQDQDFSEAGNGLQVERIDSSAERLHHDACRHPDDSPPLKSVKLPMTTFVHTKYEGQQKMCRVDSHQSDGSLVASPTRSRSLDSSGDLSSRQSMGVGETGESETESPIGGATATHELVGAQHQGDDDKQFVWFGQSDSSQSPQSNITNEGRRNITVPARIEVHGQTSPSQQVRSKAAFLLQMEVRRQRSMIERACRIREEEVTARRVRVGAEVLKSIKMMRGNDQSVPLVQPHLRPTQPPQPQPASLHWVVENIMNTTGEESKAMVPGANPLVNPEKPIRRRDFDPLDYGALRSRVGKVLHENTDDEEPPAALGNTPTIEHPPQQATDNPWRKIGRARGDERREIPTPTPPPIVFDVMADGLQSLAGAEEAVRSGDLGRRQERYEALRARKLAQAEERRRIKKEREDTAREGGRRAVVVASPLTPLTPEERRLERTKEWGGRKGPVDQNLLDTDANQPPGLRAHLQDEPAGRPPSSAARRMDYSSPDHANYPSPSDFGGGGSGGARALTPGSGRSASPVVRGLSQRSNRKLVRNAINFLCLAGGHLKERKIQVLEALDAHPGSNFVLLLAHNKLLTFKGLYARDGGEDVAAERVFGLGPSHLDVSMVSGFYKYNSAAREFREVHSKTLGKTTDAVSVEPTRLRRPKG